MCPVRFLSDEPPPSRHAARPRGDLGLVVHVHQDRGAGHRALDGAPRPLGLATLALLVFALVRTPLRETASAFRTYTVPLVVVGVTNTALPVFLLFWAGACRRGSTFRDGRHRCAPARRRSARRSSPFSSSTRSGCAASLSSGCVLGFAGVGLLVGTLPTDRSSPASPWSPAPSATREPALHRPRGSLPCRRSRWLSARSQWRRSSSSRRGSSSVRARHRGGSRLRPSSSSGFVGTAFAYLLYYELVSGAGARRAILITYLVPPAALVYGVIFLGEELTVNALCALALILGVVGARHGRIRSSPPSCDPLGDLAK